ncbi:MAG: hypothetical protein GX790_09895, partial [Syntrophomonadaceae bacterium]|nr:hypothetical protein [Syntrophomonadaceae bacterium]
MKLKIGTKIYLGFALVILFMMVVGVAAVIGFNLIAEINEHMLEVIIPGVNESKDFEIASLGAVVAVRGYLLTDDESLLNDY